MSGRSKRDSEDVDGRDARRHDDERLFASDRTAIGFTLLEMLIVLLIVGLMLAFVLERGPMRSAGLTARATAAQLAEGLRLARSQAIAANQPVSLSVDVVRHVWRVGSGPLQLLPPELGVALYTIAGARLGSAGFIAFAPDGSSTGGRIELVRGSERLKVGVDWLTGRVSVADVQ
jgi:general secretion pathway protein H